MASDKLYLHKGSKLEIYFSDDTLSLRNYFSTTKDANMKGKEKIGGIMKRFNQKENIIYYGKLINETPRDIADAQGYTYIQILNKK